MQRSIYEYYGRLQAAFQDFYATYIQYMAQLAVFNEMTTHGFGNQQVQKQIRTQRSLVQKLYKSSFSKYNKYVKMYNQYSVRLQKDTLRMMGQDKMAGQIAHWNSYVRNCKETLSAANKWGWF